MAEMSQSHRVTERYWESQGARGACEVLGAPSGWFRVLWVLWGDGTGVGRVAHRQRGLSRLQVEPSQVTD